MTLKSMTGYARTDGSNEDCAWVWEVKSVNAKGLDVRSRLGQFDGLEPRVREIAQARFQRGNVSVNLQINWARPTTVYQINMEVLEQMQGAMADIRARFPDCAPPSIDGLLGLRGVVETGETELDEDRRAALEQALLADLETALDHLAEVRGTEGAHLHQVIEGQLANINDFCRQTEALAAAQPKAIRSRLAAQVAELMDAVPALPEERLAQEAAMLMLKADVREELDRLAAHCEAASTLLSEKGAVGRKLDFLCQEFNREANTVCSKSADIELTRVGLGLKAVIEQMREQVQNVE
ncbi:MAG: YicC family protein [Rhodospirillaceae bacterium]|nr:YicC family protein [Rhodospirillaceae bacterium]